MFQLKLISSPENEGKCVCEMKVDEHHVNVNKSISHGISRIIIY